MLKILKEIAYRVKTEDYTIKDIMEYVEAERYDMTDDDQNYIQKLNNNDYTQLLITLTKTYNIHENN